MTSDLIENAKIEMHGQCPYHKGHASEGAAFFVGLFFSFMFSLMIYVFIDEGWNKWAIKKGYAYYHSETGKIVYK